MIRVDLVNNYTIHNVKTVGPVLTGLSEKVMEKAQREKSMTSSWSIMCDLARQLNNITARYQKGVDLKIDEHWRTIAM